MKLLVSHPTGNANVRAVLAAFERNNILARYFTTVATSRDSPMIKLLPKNIRKEGTKKELYNRQFFDRNISSQRIREDTFTENRS